MPPKKRTIVRVKHKKKDKPSIVVKSLQDTDVETFRSHSVADRELADLVKTLKLKKEDASYKEKLLPFKKGLDKDAVRKVEGLFDDFFSGMKKGEFKKKWRDLRSGTDEHFSTQSVHTLLETVRSNKLLTSSIDKEVLKDTMSVISHFRLPTEDTGHKFKDYLFQHPRGKKPSMYLVSNKSPSHSTFDMLRRTTALSVAKEHQSQNPDDGTGTLLSMLIEVGKISLHFTANPLSSDVSVLGSVRPWKKQRVFDVREESKKDYKSLEGIKDTSTQSSTAPQYSSFSSPTERTLMPAKGNRKRGARALSPERV